jgi:hypothetical protein
VCLLLCIRRLCCRSVDAFYSSSFSFFPSAYHPLPISLSSTAYYPPAMIHCLSSTAYHPLPITHCLSPTAYHPLPITHCLSSYHPLPVNHAYRPLFIHCLSLTAYHVIIHCLPSIVHCLYHPLTHFLIDSLLNHHSSDTACFSSLQLTHISFLQGFAASNHRTKHGLHRIPRWSYASSLIKQLTHFPLALEPPIALENGIRSLIPSQPSAWNDQLRA